MQQQERARELEKEKTEFGRRGESAIAAVSQAFGRNSEEGKG